MWMPTSPAMQSSASGSKWAGPSFTASTPIRRPVSRPATQPIVSTRSSARDGPADAAVAAAVGEGSAVGEHRPVRDEIEDQVVRLLGAGEVLAAVVDHLVGAERPHERELGGVVDARHVRAESLGELDRERARAATGPVDQHAAPGGGAVGALQRDRAGLRDRRGLRERQRGRLVGEPGLRRDRVLGEAALEREVVAVHLVTGPEPGDARRRRPPPARRCPIPACGGPASAVRRSASTAASPSASPSR